MIRRFSTVAFIAIWIAAAAPLMAGTASLSGGYASTVTGGTVEIPLNFQGDKTFTTAVNFDLEYNGQALFITPKDGQMATDAGKSVSCNALSAGKLRCVVAGLNQNVIGDGELVTLRIQDKGNVSASYTLTLSNVAATDRDGRPVAITATGGGVNVGAGGNRPTITSVVHGTSFQPGIPDGGWVTIFGNGFGANTRLWQASDFVNGRMPTRLDGVGVEIGGRPAYVYYISATQINVLAPLQGTTANVGVRVITPQGFSDSVSVQRKQFAPGFFMYDPEGRKYVIGVRHPDGALIGKASLYPGVTTPAKPNDIIYVFGTGFGQTNPVMTDGVPPAVSPIVTPVEITLGGRQITAQGYVVAAGQYQFNIQIPADLPDGDHALVVTVGGVQSPANAYITVQR